MVETEKGTQNANTMKKQKKIDKMLVISYEGDDVGPVYITDVPQLTGATTKKKEMMTATEMEAVVIRPGMTIMFDYTDALIESLQRGVLSYFMRSSSPHWSDPPLALYVLMGAGVKPFDETAPKEETGA